MGSGVKKALGAAICAAAVVIWLGVPQFAAAGLALDGPAWADHDDGTSGVFTVEKSTSWFPPGTRYEWIGQTSGQRQVEVDPWGSSIADPILWTVLCVAAAGVAVRFLLRG